MGSLLKYRDWKIDLQPNGLYHAFRIRPGDWFTGTSLEVCHKTIDRRDELRLKGLNESIDQRRKRLHDYRVRRKALRDGTSTGEKN